nr:PE-PGRS family protein [Kibdelosporangium sp. MJ126-NF4]CTQ97256.1 PE-PGRS family protein [Kibdelosporangium sp. MJ126-NF4]
MDELIAAITAALDSFGEVLGLEIGVRTGLNDTWANSLKADAPPSATNWDAYTHEELHEMLFRDADVGDVGAVAAEWGRHGTELAAHADELRQQKATLESTWQGAAAEQALALLGELAERMAAIGTRADMVQQATNAAGEALAFARASMPPPNAAAFGLPAPMQIPSAGPPAPMQIPGTAGPQWGMTFGAVDAGQTSLFDQNAMTMGTKAEAVRVMQRYESGLSDSGGQITSAGATSARAFQVDGPAQLTTAAAAGAGMVPPVNGTSGPFSSGSKSGGASGGESWRRLVGGGSTWGSGPLSTPVGAGPGQGMALGARAAMAEAAAATRGAAGTSGMLPASAARTDGDKDEVRRSTLPTVDQQLFTVEQRACAPVIGL